jgi:hypothetical protein
VRLALAALLLLPGCTRAPATPTARAVEFLIRHQGPDGLWKSETTKALATGQALTPFVLWSLSHAPSAESAPHRAAIDRALDRLPIRGPEYPAYALSFSILALARWRPAHDPGALRRELLSMQLAEGLGWSEADPEYGGWDYGAVPARRPQAQNPNVSVTAFACEALGGDAKARLFAERCRADGGFLFTPSASWGHMNKAGPGKGYATATLDAARILGIAPEGLAKAGKIEDALFFYRSFLEAKVLRAPDVRDRLLSRQRADGSWKNADGLMKEDDPLVATGLALAALGLSPH